MDGGRRLLPDADADHHQTSHVDRACPYHFCTPQTFLKPLKHIFGGKEHLWIQIFLTEDQDQEQDQDFDVQDRDRRLTDQYWEAYDVDGL